MGSDEQKPKKYDNVKIIKEISLDLNVLGYKRKHPDSNGQIREIPIKILKVSQNDVIEAKNLEKRNLGENNDPKNQMSLTQKEKEKEKENENEKEKEIEIEKEKEKNVIESKKKLNELEKKKYKKELKEKINNSICFEQENNNNNNIRETVNKVLQSYYKNNEKNFEPFLEDDFSQPYHKAQLLNNSNNINNENLNINLDGDKNGNINHIEKYANKLKNIKNLSQSQNQINSNFHKSSKCISKNNLLPNNNKKSVNNNINLEDNTIIKHKKNDFNNYSYKCLTNNLNFVMLKGTKEGMISIELENNGSYPWLINKTFLEFDDSKENINIQKIALEPLNPGFKTKVNIILENMDKIDLGQYFICLIFKVDGKEWGNTLLVNIEITDNINKYKHKTIIKALRKEYGFTQNNFSNTMIGNALENFKTFEGAFDNMLQKIN